MEKSECECEGKEHLLGLACESGNDVMRDGDKNYINMHDENKMGFKSILRLDCKRYIFSYFILLLRNLTHGCFPPDS